MLDSLSIQSNRGLVYRLGRVSVLALPRWEQVSAELGVVYTQMQHDVRATLRHPHAVACLQYLLEEMPDKGIPSPEDWSWLLDDIPQLRWLFYCCGEQWSHFEVEHPDQTFNGGAARLMHRDMSGVPQFKSSDPPMPPSGSKLADLYTSFYPHLPPSTLGELTAQEVYCFYFRMHHARKPLKERKQNYYVELFRKSKDYSKYKRHLHDRIAQRMDEGQRRAGIVEDNSRDT